MRTSSAWIRRSRSSRGALLLLVLQLGCTQLPTAPARKIDFTFVYQDREGTPLAGVVVGLRQSSSRSYGDAEYTDADGRAHFHIGEGTYVGTIFHYDAGPYPDHVDIPEFVVSEKSPSHLFRLSGAYVGGEIRAPDTSVLPTGTVSLGGFDEHGEYQRLWFRYEGGRFRAVVPPGRYALFARGGTDPSPYPYVKIDSISIVADTSLVVQLTGSRIVGSVTGRGGAPLVGAHVKATGASTDATGTTDGTGSYFVYLPDDSYRWHIAPPDTMSYVLDRYAPLAPISGPATLDFSLDGPLWTGAVFAEQTGVPLANVWVEAFPRLMNSREAVSRTDDQGAFRLVLERGLEYDLYVRESLYDYRALAAFRTGLAGADSTLTLLVKSTPVPAVSARR